MPRVSSFKVFGAGLKSTLGFRDGIEVDGGGTSLAFTLASSGNVEYRTLVILAVDRDVYSKLREGGGEGVIKTTRLYLENEREQVGLGFKAYAVVL